MAEYIGNWLTAAAALLLVAITAAMAIDALFPPTMRISYPDAKCIEIVPATAGTCQHPPERYDTQWVSPVYERK